MNTRHETDAAVAPAAPTPQRLAFPRPVAVSLGGNVTGATAYAARYGRRGHQTLIGLTDRLVWVATSRVADLDGVQPHDGLPAAGMHPAIIRT